MGELKKLQEKAKALADELGYVVRELTDDELFKFGLAFERQFVLQFPEREIVDIYQRHKLEILLGAMIAREQMDAQINGEFPGAGKVGGPLAIRAAWLGIGDDWEDAAPFATGSPQNWIHSGTALLGGTAGNPIRIGPNAVHVIIGIASLHPSPKIESVQFELDGKKKPVVVTGWPLKVSGLAAKELESAIILKKDTTVLGKVFITSAFGASADDYPYLIGASFIKENVLRVHDPANIPGSPNGVVFTT